MHNNYSLNNNSYGQGLMQGYQPPITTLGQKLGLAAGALGISMIVGGLIMMGFIGMSFGVGIAGCSLFVGGFLFTFGGMAAIR